MCVVPLPYQVCAKCLAISQLVRSCDTSSVPHSWPHVHYKFHLLFVKAGLSTRSFLPCLGMLDVPLISKGKLTVTFLPVVQQLTGCSAVPLLLWWTGEQLCAAVLPFWTPPADGTRSLARLLCQRPAANLQAAENITHNYCSCDSKHRK